MEQSKGALDAREEEIRDLAGDEFSNEGEEAAKQQSDDSGDPLESLQKERDEFYDLLLRKQAEFENYRRRTVREREDSWGAGRADVIKELLPIIDACEKGLASMGEADEDNSYRDGYALLLRQLKGILEKFGVTEVPGPGSTFDPNFHEAILREVSRDYGENEIIEEFRKGYCLEEKLLRASQVKVAVWPDDEEQGQKRTGSSTKGGAE